MKAKKEHRVPLAPRAVQLVRAQLQEHEGAEYVFPGAKNGAPLSDMSLTAGLRRMKRDGITVHGFRSTFRDWAAEQTSYPRELAEFALGIRCSATSRPPLALGHDGEAQKTHARLAALHGDYAHWRRRRADAREGGARRVRSAKPRAPKRSAHPSHLEALIGRQAYEECIGVINAFRRPPGVWLADNPELQRRVARLREAELERDVLYKHLRRRPRVLKNALAQLERQLSVGSRRSGRPALPEAFRRLEVALMGILTATMKREQAADWTLRLISHHALRLGPRYSSKAILKRWRQTLMPR
jgi:hypothetical protein